MITNNGRLLVCVALHYAIMISVWCILHQAAPARDRGAQAPTLRPERATGAYVSSCQAARNMS